MVKIFDFLFFYILLFTSYIFAFLVVTQIHPSFFQAIQNLNTRKFVSKITSGNIASISMFEKMRFKKVAFVEVFNEVVFELAVDDETRKWIANSVSYQTITTYE